MNTGSRHVEVSSDKGRARRYFISDFSFKIVCNFGYDRKIHPVRSASQRAIFYYHSFKRTVSGSLTYTEKRAVDPGTAVKPCGRGIAHRFVEIVVTVPFKHFRAHPSVVLKSIYNSLDTSRKSRTRKRHAIPHCIARSYLYRHTCFLSERNKLLRKRKHEAVKIRSRYILKVTPRLYSMVKGIFHYSQIFFKSALPGQSHFFIYVIVGA